MTMMSLELGSWHAPRPDGLRRFVRKLAGALDAFASERAQQAVSMSELRRAEREIDHYRRMMRHDLARQIGGTIAGRLAHRTERQAQTR